MEAIERLTVQYPELESLSSVLEDFESKLVAGEEETSAYMTEAQQNVTSEMADFFSLADTLEPSAGKLQDELVATPLDSITGLHSYIQAEVQNGPLQAQVVGADRLSEKLLSILSARSAGDDAFAKAPAKANSNLKNWVQEFVYEPMAELSTFSQQQSQLLDGLLSREVNLIKKVEDMSEQISTPGFNQHRVELKSRRLEHAHELFGVLKDKQLRGVDAKDKTCNFVDRKSFHFQEVCADRVQATRQAITQHKTIAEEICIHVESVARYAMRKHHGISQEQDSVEERRQQRASKVRRVSKVLREAFAGIVEIVRECHADQARIGRLELERQLAAKGSEDLQGRFDTLRGLHTGASEMAEEVLNMDLKFSDWLQDLYSAVKKKCEDEALKLEMPLNRARMRALSKTVVDQLRAERESMQAALQSTERDVKGCQEAMSALEYQQPSDVDVANHMDRFQRVQEVAKWQMNKIETFTRLEQDLVQNGSDLLRNDTASSQAGSSEDEAEGWVRKIFSNSGSGQPAVRVASLAPLEIDALGTSCSTLPRNEAAEAEAQQASPRKPQQASPSKPREPSLSERLAETLERNNQYLAHTQASLNSRSSTPRYSAHSRSSTPRYHRHHSSCSSLQAESRGSTVITTPSMPAGCSTTSSMPGGDTQLGSVYVAPGHQLALLKTQPTRFRPSSPNAQCRPVSPSARQVPPSARVHRPVSPSARVIRTVAQGAGDDRFPVKAQLRSSSLGRSWHKVPCSQGYPVAQSCANGAHHPVTIVLQSKLAEHSGASTPSTATPSNSNGSTLSAGELAQTATVLKSLPLTLAPVRQTQANSGECTFTRPGRAGVVPVRAMTRSASVGCIPGRRKELGQ